MRDFVFQMKTNLSKGGPQLKMEEQKDGVDFVFILDDYTTLQPVEGQRCRGIERLRIVNTPNFQLITVDVHELTPIKKPAPKPASIKAPVPILAAPPAKKEEPRIKKPSKVVATKPVTPMISKGRFKDEKPFKVSVTFVRSGVEVIAYVNILGILATLRPTKAGPQPEVGQTWIVRLVGEYSYDLDNKVGEANCELVSRVGYQPPAQANKVSLDTAPVHRRKRRGTRTQIRASSAARRQVVEKKQGKKRKSA